MSGSISARVPGLLIIAAGGLVGGLVSGRPELAVMAVPFLVLAGVGLSLARRPQLTAEVVLSRDRMLEGETASATVALINHGSFAVDLEVDLQTPPQLTRDPPGRIALRAAAGQSVEVRFVVRAERWGAHRIGPALVQARDRLGVTAWSGSLGEPATVRAFPREHRLRELVTPVRTQPFLGSHVARTRGEGVEFADVRPFVPGDRVRGINWRATARRGMLYVTERHPEQASDVVLLLDTFAEARDARGGTLDAAVRAAASLARGHLARRDRVALVDIGGTLHWLEPAFGTAQLYRISDALLSSEIAFSYAPREVTSIPRQLLPPSALVLAISPLLDERSIRLITDLRTRGYDVTVVEVSPVLGAAPGPTDSDALAHRLWRLERAARRARLRAAGIAVAAWDPGAELAPAVEGVNSFRRFTRHAARA